MEQRYSNKEKEQLLLLREQELQKLEEEIFDIEVTLGFHVNDLIDRCKVVYDELQEHMKFVYEYVSLWDQHKHNLWYDLVVKSYEASFIQDVLSNDFERKVQELNVVIAYYNKINHQILRQTSNIYQVLENQAFVNSSWLQNLAEWKKNFYRWQKMDEEYLSEVGALTYQLVQHLRDKAQKRITDKEKVSVAQAKKKKNSMKEIQQRLLQEGCAVAGAGGPDPDDEEWKKKHLNGKYEENPKHHQHSRGNISKPPRDGQAALDNSVAVEGCKQRVAIQDGNIIIFQPSEPRIYHGYIDNNWGNLNQVVRNALYDNGLIKNISKGIMKK